MFGGAARPHTLKHAPWQIGTGEHDLANHPLLSIWSLFAQVGLETETSTVLTEELNVAE